MNANEKCAGWMNRRYLLFESNIQFTYTNWKGETRTRRAHNAEPWFGTTEWHPEPQWFIDAYDSETMLRRDFAMKDMKDVIHLEK